jgi:hypothetical protein
MKFTPPLLAALAVFTTPACDTLDRAIDPQPPNRAEDPVAVVPADFLYTRYEPLNRWLDEAVRVQVIDTPLMSIFDHPALRGLQYHIVKAPPENPVITIDKLAMTRRQLLWVIAHDHQFHMTPNFGPSGEVNYIEVRSRSVDLPKSGRYS